MPRTASREELRSWMEGHRAANARQLERLRGMTADEKLKQISRLMASASLFDMSRRDKGDREVYEIWQRLRSRWPGGR